MFDIAFRDPTTLPTVCGTLLHHSTLVGAGGRSYLNGLLFRAPFANGLNPPPRGYEILLMNFASLPNIFACVSVVHVLTFRVQQHDAVAVQFDHFRLQDVLSLRASAI